MRSALTALACVTVMIGLTPTAARALPSCISQCDLGTHALTDCCSAAHHPELTPACDEYNACRQDAVTALGDCVADPNHCSPVAAGRCTLKLETCVQPCRATYAKTLAQCTDILKISARVPCGTRAISGSRSVRALARACQSCPGGKVAPANVPFDPPERSCQEKCISNIPTVAFCYANCASRCDGDRFALSICRRACRNYGCPRFKSICAGHGPFVDPAYLRCCNKADSCSDDVVGCG